MSERERVAEVLRRHYYKSGSWYPVGNRNGKGWWTCACGAKGNPTERSLVAGHRLHVARHVVEALKVSKP